MAVLGNTSVISLTLLDGVIGNLNPKTTNVYTLGTSSLKWNNVYATTFTGNLTGNVTISAKDGFTYSGIGTASDNVARPIWFAYNGVNGRPVIDNDFKYNPANNTITIGTGSLSPTQYSGNAATATTASKLSNTSAVGAADRPVYFTNGGVPSQTTYRMAATNVSATGARAITDNLETGIWYVNGTNITGLYSQSDGAAYVNKYSDSWIAEIYQDYRTGQIAIRGKNNGTWQAWRQVLDSSNYTNYTVTKTGTGASGTWGISISGNAATATKFASAQSVTLTGDVTGTASSTNGWSIATTLANSGATAGSYGDSGAQTPAYGATFKVPYVTVDAKGRVTSISEHTVKIPTSDNSDTKVTQSKVTANSEYRLLLKNAVNDTNETSTANYGTTLTYNPSLGRMTATHIAGKSGEFRTIYGSTVDMWLGVGTGNENHGLYDDKADKWMIVSDTAGNVTVNGNATTATKFASAQSIALTGDVTGTASSQAGWSIATTIGAGKVTNAMLAGSIANNKLANSSVTVGNKTIALGGSGTLKEIQAGPQYHVGDTSNCTYVLVTINKEASWMLAFTLRLYQGYQATDIQISGYNYGSNHWYEPQAVILGSTKTSVIKVYFGYTANWKLWVAVDGSSYTGADVFGLTNGYTQIDLEDAITITKVSSLPGTTEVTREVYRPWYRNETVSRAGTADALTTTRTLTIGSSGKSFDGSANVSWTLTEIGAAAASHTHGNITNNGQLGTASRAVVTDASKNITVADLTVNNPTDASSEAISFIDSISQDAQGKITPTRKSVKVATTSATGVVKIGTGLGVSSGTISVTYGTAANTALQGNQVLFKLNNSDKTASSAATFYAPTAGGTAGYPLIGAGTTTAPAWYGGTVFTGTAAASWKTDFNGTTDATSTTAAAVVMDGGLGVAKQLRTGGSVTLGTLDGNQHVINGSVRIESKNGSYNEGLRINRSSTGYANIYLGGTRNSTSGNQAGGWWIGTLSTPADASSTSTSTYFQISHNSTSTNMAIKGTWDSGWIINPRLTVGTATLSTTYTFYVNGTSYFNNNMIIEKATASTTKATGALVIKGTDAGLGVAGQVNAETFRINEKVKLEYNATDDSLDFVWA